MTAGYSGTPLAQELGYQPGMRAWFDNMPESVLARIDPDTIGIDMQVSPSAGLDAGHVFVTDRDSLARKIASLRQLLAPAGILWVSWPRQDAGIATDITEDVVREVALPLDLIDMKVCAIDETWSALKLVIRKEAS